jgi:hypothetical protein
MKKMWTVFVFCLSILLIPQEARVSQVSYNHQPAEPLSRTIDRLSANDHIVIVKGPISSKTFLKVVFPKETHFEKAEETTYEEFVSEYAVIDVIRSDFFKAGDRFWAWQEPNYDLEDTRKYHETGFSRSPDILVREPRYPLKGDRHIAFARKMDSKSTHDFPEVFSILAEEGMGAEPEIRNLITAREREKSKKWWKFWK